MDITERPDCSSTWLLSFHASSKHLQNLAFEKVVWVKSFNRAR